MQASPPQATPLHRGPIKEKSLVIVPKGTLVRQMTLHGQLVAEHKTTDRHNFGEVLFNTHNGFSYVRCEDKTYGKYRTDDLILIGKAP